ncbi:DUF2194 domain-containing protein [Lederbergia citri]|uniref:DUF2194 domain-containing protein n=1 Tax=Lederbergia citri TaxID=2833580 RepID=A0A942TEI6_9BACI|nr:DUF2194 domain-containing protein [Lederbergia citri]MBS4196425.1 DUF2194 domain-containing protein [Lederbergia citri]
MSNNVSLIKMMIMVAFVILFGGVILITQLESFHLFKMHQHSLAMANKASQESSPPPAEIQDIEQDQFLLVYDPDTELSVSLKNNVEKTLLYMKKMFASVPVKKIPNDIKEYKNIIILFPNLDLVKDFTILTDYVSHGGKMFFAIRPDIVETYESIHEMIGINESDPPYKDTFSVKIESDFLINSRGLQITDENLIWNSVLDISLKENSTVLASTDNMIPFLWSTPYGKGTFMVFNGTMLESEMNRGFIAGSLSYLNNNFIYPILNSKVVYIDDFPAPFPDGTHDLIFRDYKTNTMSFFHKVWWPDMLKMAQEYDVKYTAGIIETYNDDVDGPFNERLAEHNLKIFGRDLLKMGGELAAHGYNHQSLTLDQGQVVSLGYTAWKDEKDMVASLQELNQFVQGIFQGYTLKTYIPPSNVLSEDGKKAIKKAIPSISNIASLHLPDDEGISYIQEFEYSEEYNEIPRLTSDYHYAQEVQWIVANGATLYGVFSHFIHPDDILDEERSGNKTWHEMSSSFRKMLKDVKEKYPWMKSQTASESTESLRSFQDAKVFFLQDEKIIQGYIGHFRGELDFILRSDKKIVDSLGCEVEKIDSNHYLVHAVSPEFTIELGDES